MYGYGSIYGYGRGGYASSLYSGMSQMSSIRSGDYVKALKVLYAKNNNAPVSKVKNSSKNVTKVNNNLLNPYSTGIGSVQKESRELAASASSLLNKGSNNLFFNEKVYDSDAAFKAVNEFVTNYNETVTATENAGNSNVKILSDSMVRITGNMRGSLSKVGLTVGSDGKLSINKTDFKNADLKDVRATFSGNASYANMIMSSASRIESASEQQNLINTGIYGRLGMYNNLFAGSLFSGWF
ncbi:MAG: hypothetical protein K6G45_12940 [Lachnospiraceae bacterium]|nr:hypothetical protein [Lachnospiraceae bacterium]